MLMGELEFIDNFPHNNITAQSPNGGIIKVTAIAN
jgi:hypothetical protein